MTDVGQLYYIEKLGPSHDRGQFSCGTEALDHYFRKQANQDMRRKVATCFVAVEKTTGKIAGFYTIAATSIALTAIPEIFSRKLPRYPSVPSVVIGRLATDQAFRGRNVGALLLSDAVGRVEESSIAAYALVVDAKDEAAVGFYKRFGFMPFPDAPFKLFAPMATLLGRSAFKD